MKHLTVWVCLLFSTLLYRDLDCMPLNDDNGAQAKPKGFGTAKRAVIIGIDGLGGLHLRNVTQNYKTLKSFFEQGSSTTRARGVYPTSSGPCWSTYLTGMGVMEHGVFDNGWKPKNGDPESTTAYSIPPLSGRGLPKTLFSEIKKKDPNLKTALMFTWKWLGHYVAGNKDIDNWYWGGKGVYCFTRVFCYKKMDKLTMFMAKHNLLKNDPILTFIHLDALDVNGHKYCWGCPEYYKSLHDIDAQIKYLIDALTRTKDSSGEPMIDGTLLTIVSDHGGFDTTHGTDKPFNALVDVPILFRGPGVLKNNSLENVYVSSLDVATTVLNAIGVEKSEFMSGRILEQIYQ